MEKTPDCTAAVMTWLRDEIARPSPFLGRDGDVCPFMRPALDADAIEIRVEPAEDCADPGRLQALVGRVMDDFLRGAGADTAPRRALAGLVLAFPAAGPAGWTVLDAAYPSLKEQAVARDLMVAQFHPQCDVRAVRNPDHPVARGPVAALAMRRMARHDVLFLHERAEWYRRYEARFGAGPVVRDAASDPLMHELWVQARRRVETPADSAQG
ncbi:DUF6875 domain-containing protein [Actinomadura rayongensis]|uniref:DUF6875 domain-containing protein n=1 Tax=Actinomadura rayongensis TaxID=1429076 RepID=A0A6I4W721_9ACTN|nr:hypothetical protein [Actinomadura rayongensis]MXQ65987.1 hypothetical protein [Actinomadura rayongensis]